MSRLINALLLLAALASFLIEVAARREPLDFDECLHVGTPTECAQTHDHR